MTHIEEAKLISVTIERRMLHASKNRFVGLEELKYTVITKDVSLPILTMPMLLQIDDDELYFDEVLRVRPDVLRGPGLVVPLVTLTVKDTYTDERLEKALSFGWKIKDA